ncbi:hypothetical protein [Clostridium sp. JS66]|nr:hypothetical protein [Clostridium sp. JS66]WPC40034.1 hypothetical protein Q6H37_19290 [Clostridium sp. JS66]
MKNIAALAQANKKKKRKKITLKLNIIKKPIRRIDSVKFIGLD